MALFHIEYKASGYDYLNHDNLNNEYIYVEPMTEVGTVELSDQEVDSIVQLMRNKNSTDTDEIGLAKAYPDIYKKLYQAYYKVGVEAEEKYALFSFFMKGEYLGVFDDYRDELIEYCKANCSFKFELDERELQEEDRDYFAKRQELSAFNKWLKDYVHSLSLEDMKKFLYEHMWIVSDPPLIEPTVTIPQAIIDIIEPAIVANGSTAP